MSRTLRGAVRHLAPLQGSGGVSGADADETEIKLLYFLLDGYVIFQTYESLTND